MTTESEALPTVEALAEALQATCPDPWACQEDHRYRAEGIRIALEAATPAPAPTLPTVEALAEALHLADWQPAMDGESLTHCLFDRHSFAHKQDHDAQARAILAALAATPALPEEPK